MIYPEKKSKVRVFSTGGAMGSLFDNPGTYLGIQYVPTAIETPDIEGVQYLLQQDEARRMQMQQRAAKASPDMETLRQAVKGANGLDGEMESFISDIEGQFSSWHTKYKTPEQMISGEALSEKARLDRNIMVGVSKLKNSADEYRSSYDRSRDTLGDVYTDGGSIMIQDQQDPRNIQQVSIEEYYKNPDAYKGKKIMNNDDIFSWRRKYRPLDSGDSISVDQYSEKQNREYINDHFKKIGTDSRSIEGAGAYSAILADAGLDPRSFTTDDIRVKVESGQLNIEKLYSSFVNTLDHKVYKSFISSMISRGENPYEMVDVPGQTEKVSKLNLRMHEILTGVSASSNTSVSIERDTSGSGADGGGQDSDVMTNFMNRNMNLAAMVGNDVILQGQMATRTLYNPHQRRAVNTDALAVPNMAVEDKERLYGRPIAFHQISSPGVLYFEGKPVTVGNEINDQDGSRYYFTGNEPAVITYDVKDSGGNDRVVNALEMDIVVNKDGLARFGLSPNDLDNEVTGMASVIDNDQLRALAGMTEEQYNAIKSGWFGNNYRIRVQMPLADHAGHGGKSPGKASDAINSGTRAIQENQKRQAEKNSEAVSDQTRSMLNYMKNGGN